MSQHDTWSSHYVGLPEVPEQPQEEEPPLLQEEEDNTLQTFLWDPPLHADTMFRHLSSNPATPSWNAASTSNTTSTNPPTNLNPVINLIVNPAINPVPNLGRKLPGLKEDLGFNFTFTGTSVTLWFNATPQDANKENMLVKLSIDLVGYIPEPPQVDGAQDKPHRLSFKVMAPSNQKHTLEVWFKPSIISFDCLVYERGDPFGFPNGTETISITAVMSSSTNTDGGTFTAPIGSVPSPSSLALGLLVGGIVSGISVFILVLAGILWYRFKKNSRTGKSQCTAPLLAKLPPEPAPQKDKTMIIVAYDPPGYTEKNAYFGIQSLANSSSIGPTPQKGLLVP